MIEKIRKNRARLRGKNRTEMKTKKRKVKEKSIGHDGEDEIYPEKKIKQCNNVERILQLALFQS